MTSLFDDDTFDLSVIVAMPRGMTEEEAYHFLMTDELPVDADSSAQDIVHVETTEERQARRAEERAQELFGEDEGGLTEEEAIAFLSGEFSITAAMLSFYDKDQPRWPDNAPDGLGGQWRDSTPPGGEVLKKATKKLVPAKIYKKHDDGVVVAQSEDGKKRLTWDAGAKKFHVQAQSPVGDWKTKKSLNKTQAYAEAKKAGWIDSDQVKPPLSTPSITEADAPETLDDVAPEKIAHEQPSSATPLGLTGQDALDSIDHSVSDADLKELNAYTGNGYNPDRENYRYLNDRLRNGPPPLDTETRAKNAEEQVKALDAVIQRGTTTKPITVWRGLEGAAEQYKDLQPGDVLSDKAYTSTSANGDIAQQIYATKPGAAVFRIHVPAGVHVAKFPTDVDDPEAKEHYTKAQEVILGRNTQLRVVSRGTLPDSDTPLINLEVVPMSRSAEEYRNAVDDLTSSAKPQTGAMIAFVPSEDDAQRIAVEGGLPAEELHCTIKYLGEAASISEETRNEIIDRLTRVAQAFDQINAEGFAVAMFNPPGFTQNDGKDRDSCVVLLISGEELAEAYQFVCDAVHSIVSDEYEHKPWIPHATLAYTDDTDLTKYVDQTGPITFDHIRVAFAGEVFDIPLGQGTEGTDLPELETSEPPYAPELEDADTEYSTVFDLSMPDVQMWLTEYIAWAKERGVKSPGSIGHQLRDYWVRGPGAAKIGWNTDGDGTRCIKQLRKYVGTRAGGLCQYYHQLATGKTMGRHPGRPTE